MQQNNGFFELYKKKKKEWTLKIHNVGTKSVEILIQAREN